MKIVCSGNIPFAMEAFSRLGETVLIPDRKLSNADLRDADMLIVRSTVKVNRALLEGCPVKFVGTATIGIEHIDLEYLEKSGIRCCSAPGCNANSVAEYVVSALLALAQRFKLHLRGMKIGVIGVGNVGSRVAAKARALGMHTLLNDPPRHDASGDPAFLPLDRVLAESDIVTLHVPFEKKGPHPTAGMANEDFFNRLKPGAIFINSARGAVMDTDDLLSAIAADRVAHAVIDTWENEPAFDKLLLDSIDIGTPHIAGYSFDGKVAGTLMVYREACRFAGVEASWTPDALMPRPPAPEIAVNAQNRREQDVLWEAVSAVYNILTDDAALRANCPDDEAARSAHFDALRKNYPERREFRFTRARLGGGPESLAQTLAALEFNVQRE